MKFCKQPNGNFMAYSDCSGEILEINMSKRQLLERIINEYSSYISDCYHDALDSDLDVFNYTLHLKPKHEEGTFSRGEWFEVFRTCGASDEQMKEVENGIEQYIQESKEILEEVQAETNLKPEDYEGIKRLKKEIISLEAK
jgi:hypothetical protein